MKIIVGVDGSASSNRAVEWVAQHALALDAEVVAVFAIEIPVFAASGFGYVPMPVPVEPDRDALRKEIEQSWCAPLEQASVKFRVILMDGGPAPAIIEVAAHEDADLVVTGRRGRGGFAELLLGSTSHHLSHHIDRPLLIVP
jgi:nucleotide-binding universal stress UspA family protein